MWPNRTQFFLECITGMTDHVTDPSQNNVRAHTKNSDYFTPVIWGTGTMHHDIMLIVPQQRTAYFS